MFFITIVRIDIETEIFLLSFLLIIISMERKFAEIAVLLLRGNGGYIFYSLLRPPVELKYSLSRLLQSWDQKNKVVVVVVVEIAKAHPRRNFAQYSRLSVYSRRT